MRGNPCIEGLMVVLFDGDGGLPPEVAELLPELEELVAGMGTSLRC